MKTRLFRKRNIRSALLTIPLLGAFLFTNAQTGSNIAPAAQASHFTGGSDGLGSQGAWALNDGYIGQYPGGKFAAYNGSEIEFVWPEKQTINKVVFYKGLRAMNNCAIEYDDGTGYKPLVGYSNSTNTVADSVSFAPVTALKLRFIKIQSSAKGQPADFREIEVKHDQTVSGISCPATVTAGAILPLEQNVCIGGQATLVAGNYSFASNITYQWQIKNGTAWEDIAGATNSWYSFRITSTTPLAGEYRLKIICGGSTVYTANPASVRVTGGQSPTYATVPFVEDFEGTWMNGCGTGDIPSKNWTATPTSGRHIWVKSDVPHPGKEPFYDAPSGKFSARFVSRPAKDNVFLAHMDLHLDCSKLLGDKTLFFYYVNSSKADYGHFNGKDESAGENGNDVLSVWLSKDGGKTFEPLDAFYQEDKWSQKAVTISSNSAQTIIRFSARTMTLSKGAKGPDEGSDIGIDKVTIEGPCSGAVTAGTVLPSGSITVCPGNTVSLSGQGYTQSGGVVFQWEQSATAGGPWSNAVGGSGGTSPSFTTPTLFGTRFYRLKVTCTNGNDTKTTPAVQVQVDGPVYASLPFMESFESWTKRCDTLNNIPSKHWVNTPATGINSWRRNDDANEAWGAIYVWNPSTGKSDKFSDWNASNGKYTPFAFDGQHSARFHTFQNRGGVGKLDLFLDCSMQAGEKQLSFALNLTKDIPKRPGSTDNPAPNGYDYMNVYMSTDGGDNFSLLEKIAGPAFSKWEIKTMALNSNSAKTVIRFEAVSVTGYKDMGLDYVRVMPPCSETPVAGIIDSVAPCVDEDFFLRLSGGSAAGGLKYQWQRSTSGNAPWINMPGTGSDVYTTQITARTWFRVIVTCPGSNKGDTSDVRLIEPGPLYYCYCKSGFNSELTLNFNIYASNFGHNTGNVTIVNNTGSDTVYNAGDSALNTDFAAPYSKHYSYPGPKMGGYKDFRRSLTPGELYLDSTYQFIIHSVWTSTVGNNPTKMAAYIDFNQDGVYDTLTERIWIDLRNNQDVRQVVGGVAGKPWSKYNFTVPDSAKIGITGMRVVRLGGSTSQTQWNNGPIPCGEFGDGETIDYLVNIQNHPCDGPADAGTTTISDTLICPEYTVSVKNTTHASALSGIQWDWQSSSNGTNWTKVSGSEGKDSLDHVFMTDISFRLRMICSNSKDTSYSNVVQVKNKGTNAPYKCYCFSMASANEMDSSDIGEFKIGEYTFGGPGTHLNNTNAVNGRTDNTDTTLILHTDSTFDISLRHILRSSKHADAKITIFIDYNNNLKYDANELVWTGSTTSTSFNPTAKITIPSSDVVATDVPTGMRVILNDNTDPNVPSDEACGSYTSGETEDYVVLFRKNGTIGIASNNAMKDVKVYPNPTDGRVYLQYFGAAQNDVEVSVVNITGQVLKVKKAGQIKNGSIIEMDLKEFAQGMYFIRLGTSTEYVIRKVSLISK